MRTMMTAWIVLVLVSLMTFVGGCAQVVGDIDRTQPNRVNKQIFQGEWYLSRTVIDVPYTTNFVVVGDTAELERVRWEVQKDLLIAFRTYDRVEGTDKATQMTGGEYQGAPIVAYKVLSHFDVQRQYSPGTGEQMNVIEENTTDRPWYERQYVRVDWSQNVLPSLSFMMNWYAGASQSYIVETPMSYHVEDPTHPHHMVLGLRNSDGSWDDFRDDKDIAELSRVDYLETTTRVAVKPDHMEVEDWYGSVWSDPTCWYYLNADCEHQNILIRTSFMKVDPGNKYQPLHYPDNELARDPDTGEPILVEYDDNSDVVQTNEGYTVRYPMFDKFGYFRIERHGYNDIYGELESNRLYYATRWNLYDKEGKPKPIVYYLSPEFPDFLKDEAQSISDAWNEVFVEAVEARGHTVNGRMFELRDNSGQRIGDVRYSFLYYVTEPTTGGLFGYGPSNADPITGEIVSASAYVYGPPMRQYAGFGRQVVDLIRGELTPEEVGLGADVQAYIDRMKTSQSSGFGSQEGGLTSEELSEFVDNHVNTSHAKAVRKQGLEKLRRPSGWFHSQLDKIKGTSFEDRLINDEIKLLKGRGIVRPGDPIPDALKPHISPLGWASKSARQDNRKHLMEQAKRTKYMATFVDEAVAGLASELEKQGLDSDAILEKLEAAIFKSTAEHELGHTFGLRHNYETSYDALNFPRHFWDLQGDEPSFPPVPRTQAQLDGRMDEYRYSSIMEYAARFNADIQGIGAYDRAAILFGYSQMVEVFNQQPVDPFSYAFWDVFDLKSALQENRHYTSLPHSLGGIDAMFDRSFVPYEEVKEQLTGQREWTHWEVPYRFCSDEYEGATMTCAAYDAGMDPYEIVLDASKRYKNYYFFRAFKRDQAGWDGWTYEWTLYDRYFRHMLNMYQHWAYYQFDRQDQWDAWREEDPDYYDIEDVSWFEARDGGGPLTAATRHGLQFLTDVLATPQPGAFVYEPDYDYYFRFDSYPWPDCPEGVSEKADPTVDCVDLNVPLGIGRFSYTNYDVDSGYYFYERPLWVGAFSDKVVALEMLANPEVTFLGVDTAEDVQAYALGYFLFFPEILSKISGGIIADQVGQFAGTTKDGLYFPPDPFSEVPTGHTTVDPDTWSTVQYYAIWYGMSGYAAAFDNTFNDLIRVWVLGAYDHYDLPDMDDPRVATYYNPETMRTYVAVRHEDTQFFSGGYEMVTRAQSLQDRITTPGLDDDPAYLRILLDYQIELMELIRGMHDIYGKLAF